MANQQLATIGNKQTLRALLGKENVTTTLDRVATKWLKADQVKTQAMIAVARNPQLLKCTPTSFLESMVRAAELGLKFAGAGGECFMIPYKSQATLVIGFRGLAAIARRSGQVVRIEARVVYEKDFFEISYGSGQQIVHRPRLGSDRGEMVAAYALAELKNGDLQIETMTRDEIEQVRNRSRAGDKGPWKTDFSEMARKTVLRRLCKYLPFEEAIAAADPEEIGDADCDRRRLIESTTLPPDEDDQSGAAPDGVDPRTGEILNADVTEEAAPEGTQEEAVVDFEADSSSDDLDAQKRSVLAQLWEELSMKFPGDDPNTQAERLKATKYVFGQTNIEAIGNMPLEILKAGLQALKSQAAASEVE